MKLATAMSRLGTETAFEVLAKAKALEAKGHDVVHLEIGEPDFDTPANVIEAGIRALRDGQTHYGPSAGLPALREAIAAEISATRGISVDAANVVVCPGGKPIIFFSILALVDPGDEVIYPNPGFPIYESMINYVGGKAVPIRIREDRGFNFDVDELLSLLNDKTKLLILNSPANPTGGVASAEDITAVADALRERDVMVLSDEIYSRILYEGEHRSIAAEAGMREKTIILDGFSKTYAMTGWRLGYGVMPAPLAEQVARLQTNSNSCTASFTQIAGIEALTGDQSEANAMVAEFLRRRDVIVDGLNEIPGFRCHRPKGSFYVFPNVEGTGKTSKWLEQNLLERAGVAALSGTAFGAEGQGYLRFSYANSVENIQTALGRIRDFLAADA